MSQKSASTKRSTASSAVSQQAVVINTTSGGISVAGSKISPTTPIALDVTSPGNATAPAVIASAPIITSYTVTDASYNNLDDTAVNTSGGYIKINGTNFSSSNLQVYINGSLVTSTYVSATEVRVVVPALAAGTYNIMMFNDSVGAIYTSFVTSGFPTWTTSSYVSYSFNVSVQLVASGDAPLTYSLYSGTLPTGLSLSSSGLISGTAVADSVTTDLVFLVNDAQNQTTQQTVSLTINSSDTYFKYNSLLLSGETTIANYSVYEDSSTLGSAVTVNGDSTPSRFSPFSSPTASDGSLYVDGTGDYLTYADSASLRIGTSSFTIEGWFYATSVSGQRGIIAKGGTGQTTGWEIRIDGASGGQLASTFSSTVIKGTTVLSTNTWYHFALVRNGTAVNLYLNGVSEGSGTRSDDFSQTENMYIANSRPVNQPFQGFISNVRITKQALYTSTFTPSTSALTTTSQGATENNVIYLGCQTNISFDNNKIVDLASSTTRDTLFTKTGTPSIASFSPYGTNWSYYDDGASILGVPANGQYTIGTSNFTIECWVNLCSYTNAQIVTSHQSGGMFSWSVSATGYLASAWNTSGGSSTSYTSFNLTTNPLSLGVWYHIAVVRVATEIAMYINGVKNSTTLTLAANTNIGSYGGAKTWYIGGGSDRGSKGNLYISNFRHVVGTAVYTSNFTPSTSPLTAITNTKILICQDNRFKDNSSIGATLTADTSVPRVARPGPFVESSSWSFDNNQVGSYYFNGSSDYYRIATATTALGLSTGNWTVEFWIYWNSVASGAAIDMRTSGGGASQTKFTTFLSSSGNFSFLTSNTNRITQAVTVGQWYHIAIVKNSGSTKMYVNGTANATTYTDTNDYGSSSQLTLGSVGDTPGSNWMNGYISDIRVVVGTAVYTGNFTPTTTPLTAIANTTLLLNGESAGILDYTGQHAIITSGNSRVSGTQEKYGSRSLYFDGTSDYLTIVSMFNPLGISTGDFTIEGWLYTTTVAAGKRTICATRTTAADTTAGRFSLYVNAAALEFYSGSAAVVSAGTVVVNTWTHFAVTRNSGSVRLFLNGTQVGSTTSYTGSFPSNIAVTVGDNAAGTESWNGYLDELRITKGYARYVANFTIPSSAYPQL